MVTLNNSTLSRCLSKKLDELGFNQTEKWERILHFNRKSVVKHIALRLSVKSNNSHEFVGSLMEGIGLTIMNDLDTLQIDNRVICCRGKISESTRKLQKIVLQVDINKVPAGYCLLKVVNQTYCPPDIFKIFEYALVKHGQEGNVYLSSKVFLTENDDDMFKLSKYIRLSTDSQGYTHGPSKPVLRNLLNIPDPFSKYILDKDIDFVRCFPCNDISIIRRWATRTRSFQWPNKKMIEHVLNLPVYVLPVGKHGSCNEHLQWRLSFVRAEIYLIQMLNGTQTKCLVLLKFIVKYHLQPVCEGTNSYIVKNVVLWMAEETSPNKFRQKHLMARLEDGLRKLRRAIETKWLPSYMLPEKNLLSGKLTKSQQKDLLIKLDSFLSRFHTFITFFFKDLSSYLSDSIIWRNSMRLETKYDAMYSNESLIKSFTSIHQLTSSADRLLFLSSGIPRFLYTYYWTANCLDVQQTLQTNVQEGFKLRKMIEDDDKRINEYKLNKSWIEHLFSFLYETPALTDDNFKSVDKSFRRKIPLPYMCLRISMCAFLFFVEIFTHTISGCVGCGTFTTYLLLYILYFLGDRMFGISALILLVAICHQLLKGLFLMDDNGESSYLTILHTVYVTYFHFLVNFYNFVVITVFLFLMLLSLISTNLIEIILTLIMWEFSLDGP